MKIDIQMNIPDPNEDITYTVKYGGGDDDLGVYWSRTVYYENMLDMLKELKITLIEAEANE